MKVNFADMLFFMLLVPRNITAWVTLKTNRNKAVHINSIFLSYISMNLIGPLFVVSVLADIQYDVRWNFVCVVYITI